jgi:hypothetical protein
MQGLQKGEPHPMDQPALTGRVGPWPIHDRSDYPTPQAHLLVCFHPLYSLAFISATNRDVVRSHLQITRTMF